MAATKIKTLEELDSQYVLLKYLRTCSSCGAQTIWSTPRQPKHGRCLTCHTVAETPELEDECGERAENLLMAAFPGSRLELDWQPPRYPPNVYGEQLIRQLWWIGWIVSGIGWWMEVWRVPEDAGPCAGCGGRIRRYGPWGRMFCTECETGE